MLLALLLAAQAASTANCAIPMPLPPAFAAWQGGRALAAGGTVTVGRPAQLMLVNRKLAGFVVAPGRAAARATNGGVFMLEIARPGRYRVALSERAWIDLVNDDEIVDSASHEHGPACSGIAKIVDFELAPGRYALQISGIPANTAKVLVLPAR